MSIPPLPAIALLATLVPVPAAMPEDRVFLAGCGADTQLWCAHRLSDGTLVK